MDYAVQVENLKKSYGAQVAVQNVSFSVKRGQVFGLLGANGAGKSTTIECVLGTKRQDEGLVRVLGLDPSKNRKRLFEQVGVQFQESSYQEKITVAELCEMTASLYKEPESWQTLLSRFGLAEKSKSFVADLSGGQRQRLYIVLALIPSPEVVFLDELTTGLDAKARREVWSHLRTLKENGMTIVLTSHYMDEVEVLCDSICILKQGAIVFQGTVQEAVQNSPHEKLEDAYLWYTDDEEVLCDESV